MPHQQFQSTHPRGVRLSISLSIHHSSSFNPRTHEGCDYDYCASLQPSNVSIHAPTRGATFSSRVRQQFTQVSIHAPTRGATKEIQNSNDWSFVSIHAPTRGATSIAVHILYVIGFNPRTHEGCDLIKLNNCLYIYVSIHAPTRGATLQFLIFPQFTKFQSTHPRGVRLYNSCDWLNFGKFQSTHPRGVRRCRERQ